MLSITNLQNFYGQNERPKKVNTSKEVDHLTSTEDHELAEIERKKITQMLQRAQIKSHTRSDQ